MADANPTAQALRSSYSYDPSTGSLTRIDGQRPGYRVGYIAGNGYRTVTYRHKTFLEHRLIWCIVTGRWPDGQIDHINGNRQDNRLANLRDVTAQVNCTNQHKARKNNGTRHLGVTATASGRYMARMFIAGKRHYLGLHDTPQAAQQAYREAKARKVLAHGG